VTYARMANDDGKQGSGRKDKSDDICRWRLRWCPSPGNVWASSSYWEERGADTAERSWRFETSMKGKRHTLVDLVYLGTDHVKMPGDSGNCDLSIPIPRNFEGVKSSLTVKRHSKHFTILSF
jgi:hypothetical protein